MPLPRPRLATLLTASLLTASLLAAGPGIAAPAKRLSPLALSCTGCHQPAVDAASMPALNGYPAERIVASLRAARDAPAPGSIMARFAQHLSDDEIRALAAELGTPARP